MPRLTFKLPGGFNVDVGDIPSNGQVLTFNSSVSLWDAQTPAAVGEDNTSSNVGTGEGLALTKVGVDLPFKSLIGDTEIVLTGNANDITFSIAAALARIATAQTWTAIQTFSSDITMSGADILMGAGDIHLNASSQIFFRGTDVQPTLLSRAAGHLNLEDSRDGDVELSLWGNENTASSLSARLLISGRGQPDVAGVFEHLRIDAVHQSHYAINSAKGSTGTARPIRVQHEGTTRIETNSTGIGVFDTTPVAQPSHIVDADGTLADITTKFNTLLAQVASLGWQAVS